MQARTDHQARWRRGLTGRLEAGERFWAADERRTGRGALGIWIDRGGRSTDIVARKP
jgi:hypothetical protein